MPDGVPDAASQRRTVRSAPDASRRPSGENAMLFTPPHGRKRARPAFKVPDANQTVSVARGH
jgi:hypothetical protein